MTGSEALETVCNLCVAHSMGFENCHDAKCETIETLRPLVERGQRKKVHVEEDRQGGFVFSIEVSCPTCGQEFTRAMIDHEMEYCFECGQHLDWSNND